MIAQEKAAAQAADSSQKITDNIAALLAATEKSQVSGGSVVSGDSAVGNAIAQKALTRVGYYQSGVNIGSNNTKSLASKGVSVSRNNMQAGDIILFSSNGSTSGIHHVGIYIGGGNMVHAPQTGKPVQVADLGYSYWQKEWYDVRRLY